jgi:hypothetical protein
MKSKCIPLWLLRDVPSLLAVMATFWPLVIYVIFHGCRAVPGQHFPQAFFDRFGELLANAESKLNHALWRRAYRLCGWDPRGLACAEITAPTTWAEISPRHLGYLDAFETMDAIARAYAEQLRARHNIPRPVTPHAAPSSLADRRGRWRAAYSRRDGGGMPHRVPTHARGPPHPTQLHARGPPQPPQRHPNHTRESTRFRGRIAMSERHRAHPRLLWTIRANSPSSGP